jgi:hypothetical protein
MHRLAAALAMILALTACADDTPLQPRQELGITDADPIVVMSRNLYLGADIDALFEPGADLEEALANAIFQVAYTDFRSRAVALAQEITAAQPHAVGLQEVVTYSLFLSQGYPIPTAPIIPFTPPPGHPLAGVPVNFLETLMTELSGYQVAVYQPMLGMPMPIAQVGDWFLYIHYQDGEALIVRNDVAFENAGGHVFTDLRMMSVAGMDFPRLMGWTRADVQVNGRWIRFASAHLENQDDPAVQEKQAAELAGDAEGQPAAGHPGGRFQLGGEQRRAGRPEDGQLPDPAGVRAGGPLAAGAAEQPGRQHVLPRAAAGQPVPRDGPAAGHRLRAVQRRRVRWSRGRGDRGSR